MRKYITVIPFLLAALLPLAAEPMTLTVDRAVDLARSNNFNLKVQESTVATKARAKEDAWNVFIPDVGASLTLNRANTAPSMGGMELDPWTLVGNVSAQLALSPAIGNGISQLDLDYRNAMLSLESAEQSTELDIKKSFYGILLVEEQIKVLEQNIATMENRLASMEQMYRNGYITELDLLKTEAGLSSLGPTLTSVENNLELMMMKFRMDLGLDLDQELVLEGSIDASPESFNADELVMQHLPGRLDIQQLLLSREMLENALSATFNQSRLPALILSWSYSPYQADPFNLDGWGVDGFSGDNGAFSLTLSLPLEDWLPHSGTDNKLKEAQDAMDRLDYQRELAYRGAEMEIRSLVMNLNTSRENLAVLEESVEINRESLAMSRESYDNGGITLLDLETAENDLLQAESDLLAEKYNYISNLLDLEAAVNSQLESSGSETK